MPRISPLHELHEQGEGLLIPYASSEGDSSQPVPALVAAFDPVEVEYASVRRHAALFDQPHRATLVVRGSERLGFLNRMLTQELSPDKGFTEFRARPSFWLNRKGRIDADLLVLHLPDRIILDCDVHAATRAAAGLDSYVISEDVTIENLSASYHRLAMHGPSSAAILARASLHVAGAEVAAIQPGHVAVLRIGEVEVIVARHDTLGEIGLELLVPTTGARSVYEALSTPWSSRASSPAAPQTPLARRIGWYALNIARIEAGAAMYYLDYGPSSLPHETGDETLHAHVSFKKGCYLGQEVVARMDALGHPKQRLVGLDIHPAEGGATHDARPSQAETGAPIFAPDAPPDAQPIGAVTSSCISPMLGSKPIALAMVKWNLAQPGTELRIAAGGEQTLKASVRQSLRALPPARA